MESFVLSYASHTGWSGDSIGIGPPDAPATLISRDIIQRTRLSSREGKERDGERTKSSSTSSEKGLQFENIRRAREGRSRVENRRRRLSETRRGRDGAMEEEEVERRTDARTDTEVHANSTFDEMRAREIKVERAPSTTYVGRISGSAGPNGRAADRPTETDGRTDAFATHFSTFPGIGVSGQRRAEQGERIPA